MLSRSESLPTLPPDLRQRLASLIQAHDQGLGPVEREARGRRGANTPMTALQIRSFADACYPADVRDFLDALGYQALYRGDLERALDEKLVAVPPLLRPDAGASVRPRRPGRRPAWTANILRLAVLVVAVAAGGLILHVSLPKLRAEAASAAPVSTAEDATTPVRPTEDSPCRRTLRNDASAWCESALTGTRARGATAGTVPGACGDPLAANSDTVRLALNALLDAGAIETYGVSEARERCSAAADITVPR